MKYTNSHLEIHAIIRIPPYLTGQNVAKSRECIVQSLVVDTLVQILDENIAHTGLSQGRITLGPHNPDGSSFNGVKVHGIQSSLSYNRIYND
jgi:hypothetical protein